MIASKKSGFSLVAFVVIAVISIGTKIKFSNKYTKVVRQELIEKIGNDNEHKITLLREGKKFGIVLVEDLTWKPGDRPQDRYLLFTVIIDKETWSFRHSIASPPTENEINDQIKKDKIEDI